MRWRGRVCNVYSLVGRVAACSMRTGALEYADATPPSAADGWAERLVARLAAADVSGVAALYADDAVFYSHPFRARQGPREYVDVGVCRPGRAECRFGEPVVSGDRAAVDWWARDHGARRQRSRRVAGTSLLRFDADGLVVEQRDAWAGRSRRATCTSSPDWARALAARYHWPP